jgi:hypothetical protein
MNLQLLPILLSLLTTSLSKPLPDAPTDLSFGIASAQLSTLDVQVAKSATGLSNITFSDSDIVIGTLVEISPDTFALYDAHGNAMAAPDGAESITTQAAIPLWLLIRLAPLIARYGQRVLVRLCDAGCVHEAMLMSGQVWVWCLGFQVVANCLPSVSSPLHEE